ncbi:type-1 angiotensin II receptor-associated protein-like [Penaeus japonicus]|uniref:type-1 angiotensin II receptor-associated protein-like n=1 Tax=Penaeus japonicus TaxID=27405 RepID=UPI001C715945|nr:type-1 angiotensin II receptor-associated protein-like [Penaeus japonicus]
MIGLAKKFFHLMRRISTSTISKQDRLDVLFGIFFTHLTLTVWSGMCGCLDDSFVLYNSILLVTIIWSLYQRESEEAPLMAFCVNVFAIIFDIVNMSLNWPIIHTRGSMTFGAAMAIINLLLRPLSSYILFRIVQDRVGPNGTFGLPSGFNGIFGVRHSPYEDIDQTLQQTPSGPDTQRAAGPPKANIATA